LLLDQTTRIPVVFVATSCADPLFQEGVWWLSSSAPSDVMYLRCIAPYDNCALGPPLPPDQVQRQVGRYLAVSEDAPAGVLAAERAGDRFAARSASWRVSWRMSPGRHAMKRRTRVGTGRDFSHSWGAATCTIPFYVKNSGWCGSPRIPTVRAPQGNSW
jgi:hypothetical protein